MEAKRTKRFIFIVPLQGKDKEGKYLLKPTSYPSDNVLYKYSEETRFPIIPVINGASNEDDDIKITAIILTQPNGEDIEAVNDNYKFFEEEIESLKSNKIFRSYTIDKIRVPDDGSIKIQIDLLKELIYRIGDNEDLYACITFGTKPIPLVLLDALNYGYKLKENTSVKSVVYGHFNHYGEKGMTLCDNTALFYANSMIHRLADAKTENIDEILNQFLEF